MSGQKQLLSQYLNGDINSIEALVEEYKDDLYNLCFKLTFSRFEADDLFQLTWEKAIRNILKFKGNSFRNWLYTICVNTHRDILRKNMRLKKIGMIDFEENKDKQIALSLISDGITAEDVATQNQTKIELVSLVNQLPPKHKSAIVLHYYLGLSYEETASVLNVPTGTVKSRLNTAKNMLKKQMDSSDFSGVSVGEEKMYAEYS